jgi:hypothetical protein
MIRITSSRFASVEDVLLFSFIAYFPRACYSVLNDSANLIRKLDATVVGAKRNLLSRLESRQLRKAELSVYRPNWPGRIHQRSLF